MLFHRQWSLPPPLGWLVEHIWVARGNLSKPWRNAILPDGAIDLIVNLGDPQYLCPGQGRPVSFRHSWLSGERLKPIVIEELRRVNLIGIRFRPAGAWPILHIPLSEFTGHVVEMNSFDSLGMEALRDQLAGASTDVERVEKIRSWLLQRLRKGAPVTRAVRFALGRIGGTEDSRIGDLVSQIGISHRHFLREFERCVGLKPKIYARLRAFQRSITLVGQNEKPDWAATASACGYHDQAHFIHEFANFSGLSPSQYLKMRGPFLNYLTIS